ncbi:uncharacterized protein Cadr_000013601, partial [Camelus dromedarius]
ALELTSSKDEISLLVEQEFLSLTKEHLILVTEGSGELEALGSSPEGPRLLGSRLLIRSDGGSSERSGASVMAGDKLLETEGGVSVLAARGLDSALAKVTSILRAAKVKSAKGAEDRGRSLGASNMEIGQLLSQFPLKSTEMAKVPEEMVLEETRVIKDFLQNSMLVAPRTQGAGGLGPFLLLPPPPPPAPSPKLDKLLEIPAPKKKQAPSVAKICSKAEADPGGGRHRRWVDVERDLSKVPTTSSDTLCLSDASVPSPIVTQSPEWNPGTKELTKARQSLLLSQWTQSQKEPFGEEGCSDPMGSMSVAPPTKKPAWPAEKNLLYEFLGATKNPSGQLRLRSKVEVDGLELKLNPPATGADKNNLKYTGNVSTPRFATGLTSATLNQPLWLNLNYPPPPVFTNPATFPQCQVSECVRGQARPWPSTEGQWLPGSLIHKEPSD